MVCCDHMTIAACHISPEGVVLGADSTSTVMRPGPQGTQTYYLDYEQKVFEIGPKGSTLGLVTWGAGRVGRLSHRTIAAKLGKESSKQGFESVLAAAERCGEIVQQELINTYGNELLSQVQSLFTKYESDPTSVSEEEWLRLSAADSLAGGYFIAGRIESAEPCRGYAVEWNPCRPRVALTELPAEAANFRGVPQVIERLIHGYDRDLVVNILESGKWQGSSEELLDVLQASRLIQPTHLPIREAIDWVHTVIHTTIRAIKFAGWHMCGGPVEIAVITTDRPFRWVCHKRLGAAIITSQERTHGRE